VEFGCVLKCSFSSDEIFVETSSMFHLGTKLMMDTKEANADM
jgi:hypothetical protein